MTEKKSGYVCWHGDFVRRGQKGLVHIKDGSECDDPKPIFIGEERK